MYNFDPYNVLLSIATNISVLLMTVSKLTSGVKVLLLKLSEGLFTITDPSAAISRQKARKQTHCTLKRPFAGVCLFEDAALCLKNKLFISR